MNVLVLNSGSSSLKFQLIATDPGRTVESGTQKKQAEESGTARLCRGVIEWIGGEAIITVQSPQSPKQKFTASLPDVRASLEYLLRWMDESRVTKSRAVADIDAVGHRIVHGGELCILDEARLSDQRSSSKVA